MKMYIMVKEDVPVNMVPVICSHASLSAYLKYQDDQDVKDWLNYSFRKVICKINQLQFDEMKKLDKVHIITESALDGKEVAIVILPRPLEDFPGLIKFASLYKIEV